MASSEVHVTIFAEASDELKAFIRAEVRKALAEILSEPQDVELDDGSAVMFDLSNSLPDWARKAS